MGIRNYTTDMLAALRAMGGRTVVICGTRRVTGAEAFDTVLRFTATLRESGLGAGDGVGLFVRNSPETLFLQLAIHFLGCRLVFLPPEPSDTELAALVRLADVKALLCDPALVDRTMRVTDQASVPHLFAIGPSSIADDFVDAAHDRVGLTPDDAADGRHVVTVLYTGGTAGSPKLATHRASYYDHLGVISAGFARQYPAPTTSLICTLLTHSSGHIMSLVGVLNGWTTVLLETFDAGTALSIMDREQVNRATVVTPMIYELLDHPGWPADGFPALGTLSYTGSAPAPARLVAAIERFGPVLEQHYGLTKAGPGVEVELRDQYGQPVPSEQVGEICVRSRSVMADYWNDPERTAEVLDRESLPLTSVGKTDKKALRQGMAVRIPGRNNS